MAWECCTRLPFQIWKAVTSDTIDNDRDVDIHAHMEEIKISSGEGTVITGTPTRYREPSGIYTLVDPKTGEESIVAESHIFRGRIITANMEHH